MIGEKNSIVLSVLIIIMLSLSCCSEVRQDYHYTVLNHHGFDTRDTLTFTISLEDSLSLYDIFLCSRLSPDFKHDVIDTYIKTISPLGNEYCEIIALPVNDSEKSGMRDIEWHYRTNISTNEIGQWKFSLLFLNSDAPKEYSMKEMYGFGIYCKKNERKK